MAEQKPINGMHHGAILKLIDGQIRGDYDIYRMQHAWRNILAGDNDPEELVKGICQALSYRRYVPKEQAKDVNIIFNVTGNADPEALAKAIQNALRRPVIGPPESSEFPPKPALSGLSRFWRALWPL